MLRRAATRSVVCRPAFVPAASVRTYVIDGKIGEREKAFEERAIRSHDQELLKKLRESLGIKEDQPIPEAVVSQVSTSVNPFASRSQSQQQTHSRASKSSSDNEPLSREDFLEFRREIVQRLRNLEDDIMDLQTNRRK